ncbi:AEC family transporter [Corynebacterium sp. 13CS0277]|uniref:AEC family transporter n=1 Tax=Corynebacterium sp. 13CS0277 TaxID=2071994 RepID=UPI000D030D4A|nr:AEC family transporter [Corynebacterium sp. 13CS0277]PRQ11941.1 AEC family transporter [Corynebacterium sp. 13CS0277]
MTGVLQGFTIIFAVIFAGYLLARFRIINSDEQRLVLNRVAFFAATPALLFTVVAQADATHLFSPVIAVQALSALLIAAIFVALSRVFFPTDKASTVMGAASTGYVNSNNIGLPVGMYVLGNAAYVPPLLVLQLVVFTPIILALIAPGKAWQAVRQAVTSPIVLGAAAGLVVSLNDLTVPELVWEPLTLLGGASIPMILMSFGASLRDARPLAVASERRAALTGTALKIAGMPVMSFLLAYLLGLRGDELYACVILAALPTAQNVYNYAATYQKGMVIARDVILLSTFIALPVMLIVALAFGR